MQHAMNPFGGKNGPAWRRNAFRSMALIGFCLLGAGPARVSAEAVSFSGKVVDGSGNPVPWAFIKAPGSDLVVQSGADGAFSFAANIATSLYGDPRPRSPSQPLSAAQDKEPGAAHPIRFLLTGRAATASHVASTLLLSPGGNSGGRNGEATLTARAALQTAAARPDQGEPHPGALPLPPPPPPLEKAGLGSAAAPFTLTVAMARYKTGNFPQAQATAQNLVLTLSPSATDTAAYAAEKRLCLDTINAYRATLGLKPVVRSASLEAFADQGARYDSDLGKAHAHFGAFSKGAIPSDAENAIPGWPLKNYKTVANVVGEGAKMMWAEGPGGGHYENIKGSHASLGCGIHVNPAGGVWVIHNFK